MSQNKTIFIIPGFKEEPSDKQYKWMVNFFNEKGFFVKIYPVKWNYNTISNNVKSFKEYYLKHKTDNNYLLGFSFGAMIAFVSAPELKPDKLYLCSLSPYFKEDIKKIENSWGTCQL